MLYSYDILVVLGLLIYNVSGYDILRICNPQFWLPQICGILLIVFGALLFSNIHNIDDFAEALRTQQVPITMIVLGTVILLISWFGCCGAIRESYCMSMTVGDL